MRKATGLILFVLLCTALVNLSGCGMAASPTDAYGGGPQDPPLPRTESILPLAAGNRWLFSNTVYGSAGDTLFSRARMELEIPHVYGRTSEGVLEQLDAYRFDSSRYDDEYVYSYEWDNRDRGFLLVHRGYEIPVRGVYVIGSFSGDTLTEYDSAQLWLKYPAEAGDRWEYLPDPQKNPDDTSTMEVVSTSERFYCPLAGGAGHFPLTFVDCYLYRERSGKRVSYYYYHPEYGALGYLQYVDGRLRNSYVLEEYHSFSF